MYDLQSGYYVRSMRETDLRGNYPTWFEDQEVTRYSTHGKFLKNDTWFRGFYDDLNREDRVVWAICHNDDGHIGNASLQQISFVNRNAEFAILIGDKRHWGKSLGANVGEMALRHGFLKLNLERIYCGTAQTNVAMQKLASKLGMQEEGLRRSHLYLEGKWIDMLEYGILKREFLECSKTK